MAAWLEPVNLKTTTVFAPSPVTFHEDNELSCNKVLKTLSKEVGRPITGIVSVFRRVKAHKRLPSETAAAGAGGGGGGGGGG